MINPKRINGITLNVGDLDKSLKWYREKFGFEKLYDDTPNSKGIIIGNNNIELCLIPLDDDKIQLINNNNYQGIQTLCFEINKEDLLKIEDEFKEDKNIIILDNHPKYKSRIIEDPDGHLIELYVNN
jgi:catechol 2,3-dioxygenase-like lactoylglutathione lyase family enzyme